MKKLTLADAFARLFRTLRLSERVAHEPTDQEVIDAITAVPTHYASELSLSMSFTYARGTLPALTRVLANALAVNVSSDPFTADVMTVTTSALAIPLGGVTIANSWAAFWNLDATNYIQIEHATSGKFFCRMLAGEPAMLRLGSDVTAPFAQANTASCSMFYALWSA